MSGLTPTADVPLVDIVRPTRCTMPTDQNNKPHDNDRSTVQEMQGGSTKVGPDPRAGIRWPSACAPTSSPAQWPWRPATGTCANTSPSSTLTVAPVHFPAIRQLHETSRRGQAHGAYRGLLGQCVGRVLQRHHEERARQAARVSDPGARTC